MVKLSEDYIIRLKSICNISTIVSNYVELKSTGKNKKCCCPFHSEKTPSFVVFEETESFYCFGCGIGGDVITFIEKIENLDYVSAVQFLSKYAGLSLPEDDFTDIKNKLRKKILEINKQAARFFFNNLKRDEAKKALTYLYKKRKIFKNIIVKFGIGFALNSWDSLKNHLKDLGYGYEDMKKADLVVSSRNGNYYDKFRNRIMFPIIDLKGDVIGFGGRSIDEMSQPKYLNSADTLVFKKSMNVFAMNFAKNSGFDDFLLCEGYLDVVNLHQHGFCNAIATLGTSLTKEQTRLIARHSKDVILAYDMDEAGNIASNRAFLMFDDIGVKVKRLTYSSAKDPDEYINKFGARKFFKEIENVKTFEYIKFQELSKKYDIKNLEQRNKYIEEYCGLVAELKNALKKDLYIGNICSKLNLDRYVISSHVKFIEKKKFKRESNRNLINKSLMLKKSNNIPFKVIKAQEGILRYLYLNPDKIEEIDKKMDLNYFVFDWQKELYSFLLKLIYAKKSLDLSVFREILKEEEIAKFSKIINTKENYKNIPKEFEDYVNLLREYKESLELDVTKMTAKELEEKRKEKAKAKGKKD